jgi:hypothetical protein
MNTTEKDREELPSNTIEYAYARGIRRVVMDNMKLGKGGVFHLTKVQQSMFPIISRIRAEAAEEAAHQESGRHQTVLITQSSEVAAMATQTLDVRDFVGRKVEEVAA